MTILFTFIGGVLGVIALIGLEILSFLIFGRSLTGAIFGSSGLQMLVFPLGGCILGFIWGNKVKDHREQARINRELEADRIKYRNNV
jgi:hypothetical protein